MNKILFSCVGTTDPIRGGYDGSMLHIVRHYKPDIIYLYLSKEMCTFHHKDNRYLLAIDMLRDSEYNPIVNVIEDDVDDVSDFDVFYDKFKTILGNISKDYPKDEILFNLSSGTPQMKMTLAILSEALEFKIKVIQVKNFERSSGKSERNNKEDYDIEKEILENKDNILNAENRCTEPKLFTIQKNNRIAQIKALLKNYDYQAVKSLLPKEITDVYTLVSHLYYRSIYDVEKAYDLAKDTEYLDFLYPTLNKAGNKYLEYRDISEYILTLKLMQRTKRYTDFVIRLNPLIIRLQKLIIEQNSNILFSDLYDYNNKISRYKMQEKYPALLDFVDEQMTARNINNIFRDSYLSIYICNIILEYVTRLNKRDYYTTFFDKIEKLNSMIRNDAAHTLDNVTDEKIYSICALRSSDIVKKLIEILADIFSDYYDKKITSVYDDVNDKIIKLIM